MSVNPLTRPRANCIQTSYDINLANFNPSIWSSANSVEVQPADVHGRPSSAELRRTAAAIRAELRAHARSVVLLQQPTASDLKWFDGD